MDDLPAPPDFSHVTDPVARALLEQMQSMVVMLHQMLKQQADALEQQTSMLKQVLAENAELKRALFGRKSERMAPMDQELKKRRNDKGDSQKRKKAAQKKRERNAKAKKKLPTKKVVHDVEDGQACPNCGGTKLRDLGEGEVSYEYEYIPPQFIRHKHVRKKKACTCNGCVITAPGPRRVSEGVQYGPGFHAQVVVAKLCDSLPLYRQAKQLQRVGVPMSRSTLCDLFHRCAELLSPLHRRMLGHIKSAPYVNADETSIRVLAPEVTRRGFIWTFIADEMAAYVFSANRSGQTPDKILGSSKGFLQVDGFTGYNNVCVPKSRTRVGCLAHARRYFWKALETEPQDARWVLDKIVQLYQVEYEAAAQGFLGTDKHLVLRKTCSAPLMDELKLYLEQERPGYLPEGPMGKAITYATNQWETLTAFLADANISLDNNISERQLRIIALGRKNFLFLGNDEAGDHLAVLQTLVSSCELNGVNPWAYLSDVLIRIQTHPASDIDDLLPHNWKHLDSS